jgi:hypothetical protein
LVQGSTPWRPTRFDLPFLPIWPVRSLFLAP